MTLEEAKKLYMDFGGNGMAIDREDPEKNRELMKTASGRDFELWTDELLDGYFEKLEQPRLPSEERSYLFSKITGLLCSSAHTGAYLSRLIGDFPLWKKTETFWKIVILETVAGRTATLKDGLIAICAKNCPSLCPDLVRAVRDFMVFPVTVFDKGIGPMPLPKRYAEAVERTNLAISTFACRTRTKEIKPNRV